MSLFVTSKEGNSAFSFDLISQRKEDDNVSSSCKRNYRGDDRFCFGEVRKGKGILKPLSFFFHLKSFDQQSFPRVCFTSVPKQYFQGLVVDFPNRKLLKARVE